MGKQNPAADACAAKEKAHSISVSINGFSVTLDCRSDPPKAEELFHILFLEEEIPRAPSHHKQQRWNKRRIQKRWSWKRGAEREIYEKRADYLRKKWNEMKKDYDANNNSLSSSFLSENSSLQINDRVKKEVPSSESVEEEHNEEEMKALSIAAAAPDDIRKPKTQRHSASKSKKERVQQTNEVRKSSKLEAKRKAVRRREKLIERIANGETLENFVDRQKMNENEKEKDDPLFSGSQNNRKRSKSKKSKKRYKNQMKLSEFVESTQNNINTKKSKSNKKQRKSSKAGGSEPGSKTSNAVSFAAIQAEQSRALSKMNRQKKEGIMMKAGASPSVYPHQRTVDHEDVEVDVNPMLSNSMSISNMDHAKFRKKTIDEIYRGNSVFSCIPCCVEPTNTLVIDASFIECLLTPKFSLSNPDGLSELKRRLQREFNGTVVEILPIYERRYIRKQCEEFLLLQFQDVMGDENRNGRNVNYALSLYHGWKEHVETNPRIEFVAKWFAKSYFLQHSHLWSEVAVHSMVTVYDNNSEYMKTIHKNARHCRCPSLRIVYFPPFHPTNAPNSALNHGMECIQNCCCCIYYREGQNENEEICAGDVMVWHGRRCIAEAEVTESAEDYRVQIDECKGDYVVARSSLQIVKRTCNDDKQQDGNIDAEKQILDDLAFVLYTKKFWNISALVPPDMCIAKLI